MRRTSRAAVLAAALLVFCTAPAFGAAKYIFLFIGDGMGVTQVNMAEAFLAGMRARDPEAPARESQLHMTGMRYHGLVETDSLSGVTDSAAAATALATGHKTVNGAIAMDPRSGERWDPLTSIARARGMKTGVVTSSFLQDATPAAFGAHAEKRTSYYQIGLEMCESGIDLLAGGFRNERGKDKKQPSLIDIARKNGYTVAATEDEFFALVPTAYPANAPAPSRPQADGSSFGRPERRIGVDPIRASRALIMHPKLSAGSMPFAIDASENRPEMRLSDFTRRAIMMLDGPQGFFLAVEGGRIDIACHANDAGTAIREVIDFDEAVAAALEFASAHEDETLVVVTADHETGGMTAGTLDPASVFANFAPQRGSYLRFEGKVSPGAAEDALLGSAREWFARPGLAMDPALREAYRMSMKPKKDRPTSDKTYKRLYATYDPFTITAVRKAGELAGVTWTTFYHTGRNVPVFAQGAGAERFTGKFDNTQVFAKIVASMIAGGEGR